MPWQRSSAEVTTAELHGPGYLRSRLRTVHNNWVTLNIALKIAKAGVFRCDVVHVLDSEVLTLALANLRYGQPKNLVVTYRGYEFGTGAGPFLTRMFQGVRRFMWPKLASNVYVDVETVQAAEVLRDNRLVSPRRLWTIPHPIWSADRATGMTRAEARRRLDIDYDGPIFLVFGHRPKHQKALDTVVEAMWLYGPKDYQVLIAGKEADQDADRELLDSIDAAGLADRVKADLFYIPADDVETYFAACDAVVLSYRRSYLGASGVLAQACTYGKPVIASDAADLGAVVRAEKLGVLFRAEDSQDLASTIDRFLAPSDAGGPDMTVIEANLEQMRTERSWARIAELHAGMYLYVMGRAAQYSK
jgi:glycosyltransferase involved in cell wall biosynthesis